MIEGKFYTEADVAALNEELQTLRAENDKLKENVRTINRDYNLRINERNDLQGKLEVCEKYAAAFQQSSDDWFTELQKAREENAKLESELAALRKQPYPMRKADKPDCVGLWLCLTKNSGFVFIARSGGVWVETGDWYYLGPIPVLPVEQQSPQVVTIRDKQTGKESLAIPQMRDGTPEYYFLLLAEELHQAAWREFTKKWGRK